MRIAVLSDIHGNIEALEAISRDWDELWVLGDIVNYGPDPAAAVEFVRRHAAVVVRGNHDHALGFGVDPRCSAPFREMAQAMQEYTAPVLREEQKAYLRALPLTARREADGVEYFLCHAAPSDPLYCYREASAPEWEAEVEQTGARVTLVGHTHLPFLRDAGGRRLVNPGSAGQPKHGVPQACYAVIENGTAVLQSRAYAVERTVCKLEALPLPPGVRRQLAGVLRHGGLPRPA